MIPVYAGGPCTCGFGRFVRFVIPHGVGGVDAHISCRSANETGAASVRYHELPRDAEMMLKVGSIDGR